MVYRVYVEKKDAFISGEAKTLLSDVNALLKIKNLTKIRLLNRYDAENISEELFQYAINTVFSEPQLDDVYSEIDTDGAVVFAVEYLPGQFDQRADSASQCIQIISQEDRPIIRTAKVYLLYGNLTKEEVAEIKRYVINPVEAREALLEKPQTLKINYDIPTSVKVLDGFIDKNVDELQEFIKTFGLAMDLNDIIFCQEYFKTEKRNPTVTEIKMIDTYWSDHCRHTTFTTIIDNVKFQDELVEKAFNEYIEDRQKIGRKKPICLMDIATFGTRLLKDTSKIDKSPEINACTIKAEIEVDGKKEPWLILFKNETHNHPTEIEPFGGAATCIGGAIRDPLSGRAYVYGAMRVTGAGDPTVPVSQTLKGKLPQRKIVTTASAGYSSYGNQIGLATGIVDEIYHSGYVAKRMEIGAVIGAVPEKCVRREVPKKDDVVILLGGSTGRDGCGGATGSSKSHTASSLESCGAEVQKGNAPEERKLQRLFRNEKASLMIKRCNDFGAGGVSVAIGELADGLEIDLNKVPKKYEGLDGTELAISESQERMAVVVEKKDVEGFLSLAKQENLQAVPVAVVNDTNRLVMNWNGKKIVDISRDFLNSNGAEKHIDAIVEKGQDYKKEIPTSFTEGYKKLVGDLNVCSKRGLSERFDSTIGAGTVLMPFGGKNQRTPIQAMVQKVSVEKGHTNDCTLMSYGYNPFIMEKNQFVGAYLSVIESVCKLIATGAEYKDVFLTFQEYFERLNRDEKKWGKPLSALLGSLKAQKDLGIAAIGGKDSMSGTFEDISVPPTLVSFAVTTSKVENIISPEFKKADSKVYLLKTKFDKCGLPNVKSLLENFKLITKLQREGKILSCYTLTYGGLAEAVYKMCIGNGFGFNYKDVSLEDTFGYNYGAFVLESQDDLDLELIGQTTNSQTITYKDEIIDFETLNNLYENKLEGVYTCNVEQTKKQVPNFTFNAKDNIVASIKVAKPKVLIPTFPGTNCEFDSAKAFRDAGAEPSIMVINNLDSEGLKRSIDNFAKEVKNSQIIFIPGGFSGGDEPDGSGKFITAFFRNQAIKQGVHELLNNRDGLMCGICNGFQALIKLGLVPYGKIIDNDANTPTLSFNTISRHQSKIVRTRICSNLSPWLKDMKVGDVVSVPISHGEGRFIASDDIINELAKNGQIATQYIDLNGNATYDVQYNPNDSMYAIEGITSPDGRVFGKMGHSERIGNGLYKNVVGEYDIKMFKSAVKYFK